jgi:hypothetical protein
MTTIGYIGGGDVDVSWLFWSWQDPPRPTPIVLPTPNHPNIPLMVPGELSLDKAELVTKLFKDARRLLENCANALGFNDINSVLSRVIFVDGKTIDPNDVEDKYRNAAQQAYDLANDPNSQYSAWSERGGRRVYLLPPFFDGTRGNPLPYEGQLILIIHELRHIDGKGSEIDRDYVEEFKDIGKKCGIKTDGFL